MKIELWDIDRIVPYELNSKKHPPEQVEKIAASIERFGWDQPIVVDKNGVIIKGHGRRLAAIRLGLKKVPVLQRSDMTDEQVRAARIADNFVAQSDIDTDLLRMELAELNIDDLRGILSDKELNFSLADLGEINEDAFVDDLAAAVDEQDRETKQKIADLAQKRVSLAKIIGFREVFQSSELYISRLFAFIEHETGKKGEEALVAYAQKVLPDLTHE